MIIVGSIDVIPANPIKIKAKARYIPNIPQIAQLAPIDGMYGFFLRSLAEM